MVPRILLVDDNEDLVLALRTVLETVARGKKPYIRSAECGERALELVREEDIDVAIVDVRLPDVSGVDLIARLREQCPLSEVVLITGVATVDVALSALKSGAYAFVLKSFRPEELGATVEQALAKVALKRERETLQRQYRDLLERTDVMVVALDEEYKVVLFNPKATSLTGLSRDSARGKAFLQEWIADADREKMRDILDKTQSDGMPRDIEADFLRDSPRRIRWHFSVAQKLVYGIGVDVTERLARERRERETEALGAMGVLAMHLAHEIRNPLNAAVLQLHLLTRSIDKLGLAKDVQEGMLARTRVVGDEIGRLNRMLTEFLQLARPRGIAREPVAVASLVTDVLDLERESAKARGIDIVKNIAPATAYGDREKLTQVLLNVIVNAIEAMKDGGTLFVEVSEADRVVIEIGDTGQGIDESLLKNVFDPFFTTKEGGTGLGLSIVQKIIEQHDGEVVVRSEKSRGTRVRISLPKVTATSA